MSSAISSKLRETPGARLNTQHIPSLVSVAFPRAATMEIAMNGFRHSGLWPVDTNVFSDKDFAPSLVTDQPMENVHRISETSPNIIMSNHLRKPSPVSDAIFQVETISPLPSTSATGPRKNSKKRTASGVLLTGTPHKDSLKRPTPTRQGSTDVYKRQDQAL